MWAQRGIVFLDIKAGDYEAADAGIETILSNYPDHNDLPKAFQWLGDDYLEAGKYDKASNCYQYVIDKQLDSRLAILSLVGIGKVHIELGDDKAVTAVIDNLITDFNDHSSLPERISLLGDEYFYKKKYQKAIEIWQRILSRYPGRGPKLIPYLLGSCYERLEDYPKAVEYYKKVLEDSPDCKYAYRVPYRLGIIYRQLKDYEQSVCWFGQQSKLYSNESTSQHALLWEGNVYFFNIKDYQKAIAKFQEHITLYPESQGSQEAFCHMARCLEIIGHEDTAKEILERALEMYPDSIYAEYMRNKIEQFKEVK